MFLSRSKFLAALVCTLLALATACSQTATVPDSIQPNATPGQAFTVTGEIKEIGETTRIISLTTTLEGFNSIALVDATDIRSPNGETIQFGDLRPGMTIEAIGLAGGSSALLAREVRVMRLPAANPPRAKAAPMDAKWERWQIPGAGISLAIPADWVRRGTEWTWSNPGSKRQLLGVKWRERSPGWEITAMLPNHSVNVDASPVPEIGWGKAVKHTVEVYDPVAGGGKVAAFEHHILVQTDKRAYDIWGSARNAPAMEPLVPLIFHIADSVVEDQ